MDKELELEALNEAPFSKDSPARSYFARGYIKGATTSSRVKNLEEEVERLMELLKRSIYERVDVYYNDRKDEFNVPDIQEQAWQQFKTENNL